MAIQSSVSEAVARSSYSRLSPGGASPSTTGGIMRAKAGILSVKGARRLRANLPKPEPVAAAAANFPAPRPGQLWVGGLARSSAEYELPAECGSPLAMVGYARMTSRAESRHGRSQSGPARSPLPRHRPHVPVACSHPIGHHPHGPQQPRHRQSPRQVPDAPHDGAADEGANDQTPRPADGRRG